MWYFQMVLFGCVFGWDAVKGDVVEIIMYVSVVPTIFFIEIDLCGTDCIPQI